jgi:hypothetical protein
MSEIDPLLPPRTEKPVVRIACSLDTLLWTHNDSQAINLLVLSLARYWTVMHSKNNSLIKISEADMAVVSDRRFF